MKKESFLGKLFKAAPEGEEEDPGSFAARARDMIKGIRELAETTVKEVMVPRIDVTFASLDVQQEELLDILIDCGHSRIPVYKDTIDDVAGILYVKDMLPILRRGDCIDLKDVIRGAYFVPESKRLDSLLTEFKRRRVHIAVAVDEYGGVSGIVCMGDIIEEIVGDIPDEFDSSAEEITNLGGGVFLCDARSDIEDINTITKLALSNSEFDTLGGYVFGKLGKIPVKYEKISTDEADFIIQEMDGHKIREIKLVLKNYHDKVDAK